MVAPQILILLVGVRILPGEKTEKGKHQSFCPFFVCSMGAEKISVFLKILAVRMQSYGEFLPEENSSGETNILC